MRRRIDILSLLALIAFTGIAAAQPAAKSQDDAEASVLDQVQGTCRTPREAMLQLLYWVQDAEERVDLNRAAACIDSTGLAPEVVGVRAGRLKRTLDARGLYIQVEDIPNSADYTNAAGLHRWRLPELHDIEIVRSGERWVFSAATVHAIPALYEATVPPLLERILEALPSWFHDQVLGVRLWQLCGVLIIVLLAIALQKLVVFIIGTYIRRAAGRFALTWVDKAVGRIARPVGGLAMAGVFYTAGPWLQLSVHVSRVMRFATGALAAFSVAWLVYRTIDVLTDWLQVRADTSTSKLDDQLVPLLRKTLKVFTAVIGTIFVLQNLDVDVGSLLAGLGLGGLAFALAAQDTVKNFFGSLVVFIDRPFQIGDWVMIDGIEGLVEEVGFRTTRVRTFYDSLVTVPNAKLTDTGIDNYGARKYRRYVADLALTYDTPPERMEAFCAGVRAIIQRLEGMRKDFFVVEFDKYRESGLNVMIYCFMTASTWVEELRTRTQLNVEILRLASALGVAFALPTRTLHLETQAAPRELAARPQLDARQIAAVVEQFGPKPPAAPDQSA